MTQFILDLPLYISIPLCFIIGIGIAFLATFSKRKDTYRESFRSNHDLTSYLFNAFGLIYAVLIAFVVFATWNDYQEAKQFSQMEINETEILYTLADSFGEEMETRIKDNLIKYVNILINDEWSFLADGKTSKEAVMTLLDLRNDYFSLEVETQKQSDIYQENLSHLNKMVEFRKMRIINSQQQVPLVLWIVLFVGYITSILYTYFFVSPSRTVHVIVVSALLVFNTLVLYMIFVLDHPFNGYNSITVDFLESAKSFFELIDHSKFSK